MPERIVRRALGDGSGIEVAWERGGGGHIGSALLCSQLRKVASV